MGSRKTTYISVHKDVANQLEKLDCSQFSDCNCKRCCDLFFILTQILKGCQQDTLQTGSIMLDQRAIGLSRLEFSQLSGCTSCEQCPVFQEYKDFYSKYLEQWTDLKRKYAEAQGQQELLKLVDLENQLLLKQLAREMERAQILRKHLTLSNASYAGLEDLKREEEMLERSYVRNSVDIRLVFRDEIQKKRDAEEEKKVYIERIGVMERRLGAQRNLYYQDIVVSELKQTIGKLQAEVEDLRKELNTKDETIEELQQAVPTEGNGQKAKPVIINVGECSFRTRAAAVEFLSRSDVLRSAEEMPGGVFYDEYGLALRQYRKQFAEGKLSADTFHAHEINRLKVELKAAGSEVEVRGKTIERLKTELEVIKAKYKDHEEKAESATLSAHLSGDGNPFEEKFKNFFVVVGEGESCLQENSLYDAFLGEVSSSEKQALLEWMHSCCHNSAECLTSKEKKRFAELGVRSGKNVFSACLRAIGGIYKLAYKGQQCVWINIKIPSTKKRKVDQ